MYKANQKTTVPEKKQRTVVGMKSLQCITICSESHVWKKTTTYMEAVGRGVQYKKE